MEKMNGSPKSSTVLLSLAAVFVLLAAAFLLDLWGHPPVLKPNPPVDPAYVKSDTVRRSYAELVKAKEDLSDFDCYGCHEKGKPPVLKFDANHKLIVPKEHENIVMAHGRHNRNNNCFNCHDEQNLERFQARDGQELKFSESTPLCGSCHGPTYRDWEAGVHGRTGGSWARTAGQWRRQDCVSCHNPHSPKFPGRQPAPGPTPLRPWGPAITQTKH
jgi:hypothetical protein